MGEQFPLINPSFDFVPLFTGLRQRSIRNEITPQRFLHRFVRKELNHFPSRDKVCGLVTSQVQSVATHVTATSHSCDALARLIIFKKTMTGQSVAMQKKPCSSILRKGALKTGYHFSYLKGCKPNFNKLLKNYVNGCTLKVVNLNSHFIMCC